MIYRNYAKAILSEFAQTMLGTPTYMYKRQKVNVRSYEVETEDRRKFHRDRVHLHRTKEELNPQWSATMFAEPGDSVLTDPPTTTTDHTRGDSASNTEQRHHSSNDSFMLLALGGQ